MICPHCQASLRYIDRRGRRCDECKQQFALEPRDTSLRLHDLRVKRAVQFLSANDTLFFTPGQLRHHLSRKAVAQKKAGCSVLALTIPVMFVGLVFTAVSRTPVPVLIALVVAGVLIALRPVLSRRRPTLPLTADRFRGKVLDRWQEVYGALPGRLLTPHARAAMPPAPALDHLRAVLVCPEGEVRDCLRANGLPARLGLGLLPAGPPFSATDQALLDHLRARPRLPLLLLHDASPAGLLLAEEVRQHLNLPARRRIVDLGLQPRQAIARKLMALWTRPPKALLARLQQRVGATGAGSEADGGLNPDEFAWLEQGYYSPLLALTPAQLIRLVERAVERAAAARPGATEDQDQARAVGFMTWPAAS